MKTNLPTSIGGLNLRDSLDSMSQQDTIQQDNVIPDVASDKVRRGYVTVSNPDGEEQYGALNLIGYRFGTREELLSSTDSTIYLQNQDQTRTELKTGFTNSDWKQNSFTDGAGNVSVFIANGTDIPQRIYDNAGTITVEDVAFTGLPTEPLESPMSFKNRLYFVEKNSFNIYYGGVDSIGGALAEFPTSAIFNDGGYIKTIANWTQDAGTGNKNLFTIITSEGEVAIYTGSDPAVDFSLLGVYKISRPVGIRCTLKLGGDLVVITEQGFFPLSSILNQDRSNKVEISDKINKVVEGKDFTKNWSIHWYSSEGLVLINSPSESSAFDYEQYVLNIKTNGWCRFVGVDALNWLVLGEKIYFCNETGIYQGNVGTTDDGAPIKWFQQKAYNQFNTYDLKQILELKIRDNSQGSVIIGKRVNVDFDTGTSSFSTERPSGQISLWDESLWDVAQWSEESAVRQFKTTVFSRPANFISIGLFGETSQPFELYSTEVNYVVGNGYV